MTARDSYLHAVPVSSLTDEPYPERGEIVRRYGRYLTESFQTELTGDGSAVTGLSAQRAANIPATGTVDVLSGNAGDTTQTVTVYGIEAGILVSEDIDLNGTTPVSGAVDFDQVLAVVVSAAHLGTITVRDTVIPTTLFTLAAGVLTRGFQALTLTATDLEALVRVDTNAAVDIVLIGTLDGLPVSEVVSLATAATTPVTTVQQFDTIDAVLLGAVAGARTVYVSIGANEIGDIPFEPAIVDIHDLVHSIAQRQVPGSVAPVDINLVTGAAATEGPVIAADGDLWKITIPFTVALPGATVRVSVFGFKNIDSGL